MPASSTPASDQGAMAEGPERDKKSLRHELRTCVNQVLGYSELVQEDLARAGQHRFVSDLKRIANAARRLQALVDRVPESTGEGGAAAGGQASLPDPPAPPSAPARERRAAGQPPAGSAPATLLVVDDDEGNRDVLARVLRSKGYSVLTAGSGPEAIEIVESRPVDLVLLDIMMPQVSGLDVLKALRERHPAAALPIIMATAKDQPHDVVQALSMGANDYVAKPLDFAVLMARTEAQLSLKRAMAEIRRLNEELKRRNQFIRRTFGRYLSDEVVSSLLETPEGQRLGGEKRVVTLLMSDLRGFTALAERLAPEQVVRLLNNYLGAMADVITRFQGTIDEFIGDAILALFGAPLDREDDAERAAACAVAMQLAMAEVNETNRREGLPEVQMGVAVHSGEVIVGNIGSQTRAKYGVVGTNVNLTARIESFTLPGQILVSDSAAASAGEALVLGESRSFQAKGFKDPVTAYELKGVRGRHGAVVPPAEESMEALSREIPVSFTVVDGTHVRQSSAEGRFVRASATGAWVRARRNAPARANLRIRVRDEGGEELPVDLYAKVVEGESDGGFQVRFSSAPPEVVALIRSARRSG
ncbi:MAG: adenylate/guanylate cyclase domain-containing response regulator [Acidobacteria bacterium]|nr:MAG: adenylate/guanylate cyclase domain-containing response regulator [Acidobacteriota bacterium]